MDLLAQIGDVRPTSIRLASGNTVKYCAAIGKVSSTKAWLSSRWTTLPPGIRIAQRAGAGSGTSNLGKHQIGVR